MGIMGHFLYAINNIIKKTKEQYLDYIINRKYHNLKGKKINPLSLKSIPSISK